MGASLVHGAYRPQVSRDTITLSVLSAVAFMAVDVFFVLRGTISPIYLADAAVQAAVLLALAFAARGLIERQQK
jgi:hypothetical protein